MTKEPQLPPFYAQGETEGHFFALAYARGNYVHTTSGRLEPCFLVLYFSTSADYTRYSFQTVSEEGRCLSYKRGNDRRDTLDFALLTAWAAYEMPPHLWHLYPKGQIGRTSFLGDEMSEGPYWSARLNLCVALYPLRGVSWFRETQGVGSLFQLTDTTPQNPLDSSAESQEIFEAVLGTIE